ncbi:MAG: hypothetical protein KC462_03855 [Cyanobacteria bacterium HKST-UBA05]|nr:hypothetical protein [Cyanobacteria bacterium HKST-UBA05]
MSSIPHLQAYTSVPITARSATVSPSAPHAYRTNRAMPNDSLQFGHQPSPDFDAPPPSPDKPNAWKTFWNNLAPVTRLKNGVVRVLDSLTPGKGLGHFVKNNLISIGASLAFSFFLPPFGAITLLASPIILAGIPPLLLGLEFVLGMLDPVHQYPHHYPPHYPSHYPDPYYGYDPNTPPGAPPPTH